jgi:peptide/nickel transport system permease protein
VSGILQKDFPVVQGGALAIAFIYTLVNVSADVLYAHLDPRIHYG